MHRPTMEFIHHSNLIEGIDENKEDLQSWQAWEWLIEKELIDERTFLRLHKRITRYNLPVERQGHYRQVDVTVGAYRPPSWDQARVMAYHYLIKLQNEWQTLDPVKMHIEFEMIHPFIDGNGRTGRMLMWWHQVKLNVPATFIDYEKRQNYYDWFREDQQ